MDLKQFNAILNRPTALRYDYFLKKAVDTEMIWGLYDEGWAMTHDDQGMPMLPLWPKSEFAQHCAIGEWKGYSARPLDLFAFMSSVLPKLELDEVKVDIFHNNSDSTIVKASQLSVDLQMKLKRS